MSTYSLTTPTLFPLHMGPMSNLLSKKIMLENLVTLPFKLSYMSAAMYCTFRLLIRGEYWCKGLSACGKLFTQGPVPCR